MTNLEITTVAAGAAREEWVPLLELADEPEPLRRYLHDGELFGVVDTETARPLAAVLVIQADVDEVELRAVAVDEAQQGAGIGSALIRDLLRHLRERGVRRVVVGTASSGVRQLAFYQRLGFRLTHIDRDYFDEAKGYPPDISENGIPTRDMVWMALDLAPRSHDTPNSEKGGA